MNNYENVTASDVLRALFNPADRICFRVLEDRGDGMPSETKLSCECAKYREIEGTLKEHNGMNRSIRFVVNCGGQNDGDIVRINAQFVKMTNGSLLDQKLKINAFPIHPSMVIKSQGFYHAYWFMDSTASVEQFRSVQTKLVKYFDGDPMFVGESSAMQLPGFMCFGEGTPAKVTCASFFPDRKYTQEQLSEVLPETDPTPAERKSGTEKGIWQVMRSCAFLQHCRNDAASMPEDDWHAMVTNLAPFEGGTEMIHGLSSLRPGYSEANTQKKINHVLDGGAKPTACKAICGKGFKCPKFTDGKCPAKSPAALRYQPLPTDDLTEILHEIPVTNNPLKDIEAAKQFVLDYLYNQDEPTADVFINEEIYKYFGLRQSYMKSLNVMYKKASKSYQTDAEVNKAKANSSLPDWYEPTTGGIRFLPGVLSEHLAHSQNVINSADQYYRYQDGVYRAISDKQAQKAVQKEMLPRERTMAQITDAEKQWKLLTLKDIRELNANPYIINVRNGLFNVLDGKLTGHRTDYYSTVQLDVSYDDGADCPLFKKYLEESMDGDMDQVALIQEMLGYFLIPVNAAQKCFVIVGEAAAGKSVLLRVINEILLGRQNVSNVSWQALNDKFKTAELFGKLANIFADLPTKNIDDNGIFKALVGEDYLTVEKKNRDPFSFQSTARLLFSCNSIPKNCGDKSEGFYRRLIIIRFSHAVPKEKRDPGLLVKFGREADGIFMFALEGLRRLISNHFVFSETQANADELQSYREESDPILSFVRECCELDSMGSVGTTELYNKYEKYCAECGVKPDSLKAFVQKVKKFPDVKRFTDSKTRKRSLAGVRLAEDAGRMTETSPDPQSCPTSTGDAVSNAA